MPTGDESYTRELADLIIAEIEDGKSLRQICREHDAILPSRRTIQTWKEADVDGFASRYARAEQDAFDAFDEEILCIADNGSNDTYTDADGNTKVDHEAIQRSRLRIDARKWVYAKRHPERYGDKLDLTTDGEKLNAPTIILGGQASVAATELFGE